jgi:hypothetical protein
MPFSVMLRCVTPVRTDVSEEGITSIIRVTRVGELLLVTANVIPSSLILFTLMMEVIRSSKTSIFTKATWHHIPEEWILHITNVLQGEYQVNLHPRYQLIY